jgi:death-on-curing protein
VDGNKRVGLLSSLVFLGVNGVVIEGSSAELYDLTLAVAEGRADKEQIAAVLRSCVESHGS